MNLKTRFKSAWNAFLNNKDPTRSYDYGGGYSFNPGRTRMIIRNERSIVTAIFNRIAIDVASNTIQHVKLDDNNRYSETVNSKLNNCLTVEANIDQTNRAFIRDVVMSMLDEGVVAVVPVDTTANPAITDSYDIVSMRTGKIQQWYPNYVRVNVYNDRTGNREDLILNKLEVAIIENPLYAIINEYNSTLQRLIRKLNLLDYTDEQNSSDRLDLIIQLPYTVKSDGRRNRAEERKKDIEAQLTGSKYGIAYIDSTEKITQINRGVENQYLTQIEYLTKMLYAQLGITEEILNGTANDATMLNYYQRTIEPISAAIVDEFKRKFLSKTARTQGQTIYCFKDPFKLVTVGNIAEIADKFTRNEIMTSNEIRQVIGMKPSGDPEADVLRNKNLNKSAIDLELQNEVDTEEANGEEPLTDQEMLDDTNKNDLASLLDEFEAALNES